MAAIENPGSEQLAAHMHRDVMDIRGAVKAATAEVGILKAIDKGKNARNDEQHNGSRQHYAGVLQLAPGMGQSKLVSRRKI